MFVTIRRYSSKNGSINKASLELLRRQIKDEYLPLVRKIQGFRGYYLLSVGDRELMTLSFCDTREATAASNNCAAEYTLRNPLVFELGRPEVTESEVLTCALALPSPGSPQANGGAAAGTALALWFEESRGMLLTASER
ncbi:MAG: hypothetical protein ACREMZ_08635 [Gemmatimonadales bacterium]